MPAKARFELRLTRERLFYCGMAPLVIVHAIAFTAWMALFITQAGLISARRHKLHMRFGMATVGLAVVIIVLGLLTAARSAAIGSGPPNVSPLTWFAVPFLDMVVFSGLVAGGYVYRRDPQTHKRLMLCATLLMLQPGVGRIPLPDTFLGGELGTLIAFLSQRPCWRGTSRSAGGRTRLL